MEFLRFAISTFVFEKKVGTSIDGSRRTKTMVNSLIKGIDPFNCLIRRKSKDGHWPWWTSHFTYYSKHFNNSHTIHGTPIFTYMDG